MRGRQLQARYGISWGALGAVMVCYDEALRYAKERVVDEYCAMLHMVNLETVRTCEGTHDIHMLILGEHATGLRAIQPSRSETSATARGQAPSARPDRPRRASITARSRARAAAA